MILVGKVGAKEGVCEGARCSKRSRKGGVDRACEGRGVAGLLVEEEDAGLVRRRLKRSR